MTLTQLHPSTTSFSREYPFAPNTINTGGYQMHYVDEGQGQPVLMVHGNPSWSFLYRRLIRGLAPAYRCIAPDHIGCGRSEKPNSLKYTLNTRINHLVQLVEELDLRNIHLVVHDWGGAIGMGTALRLPERFSSFTILNTAAFHLPHIPFRINICKIPLFGEIAIRGCNGFAWPATWMAIHQQDRMTPEIKRGFLAPYDNWQTRRATHDFILDIPMQKSHPSWDTLNEVSEGIAQFRDKPMNIFWGKTDFCFNDFFLAEWQRRFPKATVHTYDDAGHYVLEDAFERIIPQLATFLHNLKLESHK